MATTWIIFSPEVTMKVWIKEKQNILVINNFLPKSILLVLYLGGWGRGRRIYSLYISFTAIFSLVMYELLTEILSLLWKLPGK